MSAPSGAQQATASNRRGDVRTVRTLRYVPGSWVLPDKLNEPMPRDMTHVMHHYRARLARARGDQDVVTAALAAMRDAALESGNSPVHALAQRLPEERGAPSESQLFDLDGRRVG